MKLSKYVTLSVVAFAMPLASARADHNGYGAVERLEREAQQLDTSIQYSSINYNVKVVSSRFVSTVSNLSYCDRMYSRNRYPGDYGADQVAFQCRNELLQVKAQFSLLSRYLADTAYDYPMIYRQYLETQYAVQSVQCETPVPGPFPPRPLPPRPVPGPFPPRPVPGPISRFECFAKPLMHRDIYRGMGVTLAGAQASALGSCRMNHANCLIQSCSQVY